jgi:hypothetical protein
MLVYPGDWPAGRAKIFSALRKKKITAGKMLQKIVLCYWKVSKIKCKYKKLKAEGPKPKTFNC